ncbi:MAG TPA: hypothetical protein VLB12_03580, partial [Gemmatimonadales bacterium]|nr:hypothetical protein [Gemmatimonadales bacterium]
QNGGFSFLVPWPIALGKVQAAVGGTPTSLDCTDQPSVIGPEEMLAVQTAITVYNQHIQAVAQNRGWAYFDVNPAFAQLKAQGQIPVFPDVSGIFVPPPQGPLPITFGPIFSLDGIHPSTVGQRMIADSLASAINQQYGTSLPVPVCGTVTCPVP